MPEELTFLSLPNSAAEKADLLILPVPLERTVSFKPGTAGAPKAILEATDQLEFYEEDLRWSPFKHMLLSVLPSFQDEHALPEQEWHSKLTEYVSGLPASNLFVGLGGEHSVTPSLVAGRMASPGTIVFLDAHADMRSAYGGSCYSHACPVYRLIAMGHRVLLAGIRSVFESEAVLAAREPLLRLFMDRDLRDPAQWEKLLCELREIQGQVYLSIDMDVFNPALVPGVGTPQPGGLSWHQVMDILQALFSGGTIDLRGADIVELVPETSRVSEMTAAKLLQKIVSYWGKANGYANRPETGSQVQISYE